jgi:hypothetical protein
MPMISAPAGISSGSATSPLDSMFTSVPSASATASVNCAVISSVTSPKATS